METAWPLTLHLMGAIGLYMVALGAGTLIAPERWQKLGAEMEGSPGLTIVMGLLVFAIGVALLGVHHGFADHWQIVVTTIGGVAALEGLLILAVPRVMLALGATAFAWPRPWAAVTAVLGLVFILIGLLGRTPLS
jgi:hypothetical protein